MQLRVGGRHRGVDPDLRAPFCERRSEPGVGWGQPADGDLVELERHLGQWLAMRGGQPIGGALEHGAAREPRAGPVDREVVDGDLLAGAEPDPRRPIEIELLPVGRGGDIQRESVQADVCCCGGGRAVAAERRRASAGRRRPPAP